MSDVHFGDSENADWPEKSTPASVQDGRLVSLTSGTNLRTSYQRPYKFDGKLNVV